MHRIWNTILNREGVTRGWDGGERKRFIERGCLRSAKLQLDGSNKSGVVVTVL